MTEPLTAGEPLGSPRRRATAAPNGAPKGEAAPAKPPKPPKKKSPFRLVSRLFGVLLGLVILAGGVAAVAGVVMYNRFSAELPDHEGLAHYQPRMMSRLYTSDSRLLAELATERRLVVPYAAIPDIVKRAFISAEDQNFFTHRGVDPVAVLRAVVTDVQQYGQGKRPIGASTITQQVAKNMLLGNEMSLSRKAREAILAMRIETSLSKERILELYLNEIYLGLQAYGVAAAAQTYFNKPLVDLTLPEAAFLAALPKAPNNYNPFRFPDAAKSRRDWVLDRMAEDHVITPEQAAAAKATPITPSPFRRPETIQGGDYFAEEVKRELIDRFGADTTNQGGLVVRTTIDPALQLVADRALRDGLVHYDQRHGGWRGAAGRVDVPPAQLRTRWADALAAAPKPPGLVPEWRLGVVIEQTDGEAKIGFTDRVPNTTTLTPRVLPMQLADIGWARPVRNGNLGGSPRKMSEVVQPGDLVMVEPVAASPAVSGKSIARPERVLLRQVPLVQGALVSLDPATGRVLAMSGGWSFETSQFNRATQALRQPGSSFKPYVYLTALEQGISPSQRWLDAPFVLDMGTAGKWRPGNYELDFNGPTPMRIALEKSLNLVTVRIADRVGMEAVSQTAIAFHVYDSMPKVLPAALGAVETTVLKQAAGYGGFASGGHEVIPTLIDSVQDRDGRLLWRAESEACDGCGDPTHPPGIEDQRKQIADPQSTFQLITMMQGVVSRGTGYNAGLGLGHNIAGKTGTSQDFNDAWFVGYTPDLVTAVWVGFDNPSTLGNNETGSAVAGPIFHQYMETALKNRPTLKFPQPPGVTLAQWDSGFGTVTDAFKADQVPGASGPLGGANFGDAVAATGSGSPHAAGVDSDLGGLY